VTVCLSVCYTYSNVTEYQIRRASTLQFLSTARISPAQKRVPYRFHNYRCIERVFGRHAERDIVTANLSVCLSVILGYCINTNAYTQTLSTVWQGHISSFWALPPLQNSKGNSIGWGGTKFTTVRKICDFRAKLSFISETVRERPMVMVITNRNSHAADRSVPVPMTLGDLEKGDARVQFFFWRISVIRSYGLIYSMTKFGVITR